MTNTNAASATVELALRTIAEYPAPEQDDMQAANMRKIARDALAPAGARTSLREELQQQCSAWGTYWRASDSHGVVLTQAQAVELLENALGVEVEVKATACTTCDDKGMIGGPSFYAPDEGGVPCPDCIASPGAADPTGWQPIETAPKGGTEVLLLGNGARRRHANGYWLQSAYGGNGAWIWPYVHANPTHWMPLPPAPKE